MTVLVTSIRVVAKGGVPEPTVVAALTRRGMAGRPVAIISNHEKPGWFDATFPPDSGVVHVHRIRRQDGTVIKDVATKHSLKSHDFVVLSADSTDVQMAKNAGAVIVAAAWAADAKTASYGISVATPEELLSVLALVDAWAGSWFFMGQGQWYRAASLSNVSGKFVTHTQELFASKVVNTIKSGGARLQALLVVTARSLLMDGVADRDSLMWGFYPSSGSSNTDEEVLADFGHRLRTAVSRVRLAERGAPLFIRHTESPKRSRGGGGDREDPAGQIETVHLNPHYRRKIDGRNVVVLDDCMTYGVSFGVSAALLRAAGAASVTCIALGKFGSRLNYYEIEISSDPFAPIGRSGYRVACRGRMVGAENPQAQGALLHLIT